MSECWTRQRLILTVTVTAFVGSMVARVIISPLIPAFLDAFTVSRGTIGLALTGMWAATALTQFPAGLLGQRIGEIRVIVLALALTALGSLFLAFARSIYTFAGIAILLGIGGGLYMPVAASFLTKRFQKTGRALGIHSIGAPIGGLVGPVLASVAIGSFGWRVAPFVVSILVVTIAMVFARTVGPSTRNQAPGVSNPSLDVRELLVVLGRPGVLGTAIVASVGFFVYQSITSFLPTFLVQYSSFTPGEAGLLFGGAYAVAILGAPLLGWLSDVLGRDIVLGSGFLSIVGGIAIFLTTANGVTVLLGTLLIGIGMSWNGVVNSRLMDQFTDDERTVAFGFVRTGILLVASLGSVVTGSLADAFGWGTAFLAIASLMLAATLFLALLTLPIGTSSRLPPMKR